MHDRRFVWVGMTMSLLSFSIPFVLRAHISAHLSQRKNHRNFRRFYPIKNNSIESFKTKDYFLLIPLKFIWNEPY